MTIGAFAVVIVLQRQGIISDELDDLNGLYRRSPASAVVLLIFMLSLAGIPPLAGFVGKYFILQALIETGHNRLACSERSTSFRRCIIIPNRRGTRTCTSRANAPSPILTIGQKVAFRRAVCRDRCCRHLSGAIHSFRNVFAVFPDGIQWPLRNQIRLSPHRRQDGQILVIAVKPGSGAPFVMVSAIVVAACSATSLTAGCTPNPF